MRNPTIVLNNLADKAKNKNYQFQRLYRNLYNVEFFLMAYGNIYAKEGNMTAGTDGKTADGMSLERIEILIEKLKDESYHPNPARRKYISKKNGGKRPLGIPSFEDKLVQEVVRSILESIFDSTFSNKSHGFRPNRNCHTALNQIQKTFTAIKWFVEGDIKSFFDNIDHNVLIRLLRKRINDDKFIRLIWKFLRAGYIENWVYKNTYSGTPQGGIISPILSNIYLNELDGYVAKYKLQFDKGKNRQRNSAYRAIEGKISRLRTKYNNIWNDLSSEEKDKVTSEIKELRKEYLNHQPHDPFDPNYKRLQYVRYADDFLIGIIGSKKDAEKVKQDLTVFLKKNLRLDLSQEKTLITHNREKARFLGYDIGISKSSNVRKDSKGIPKRTYGSKIRLFLPREKWVEKLKALSALKIDKNNNWEPTHRRYLVDNDDLEILSIYNAEIRGFYNYYKLAINVSVLHKFHYFMKFSYLKTMANKYKTRISKIINKYRINGELAVKYETKEGSKVRYFYKDGYKKQSLGNSKQEMDTLPTTLMYSSRAGVVERLIARQCEWCGTSNVPLHIHHVRKLKDLKGKKAWEKLMIARQRKTMAMCIQCHKDLHAGRLD
ncbi:reverse transcriptase/maturase family protein [Bacillus cereus]|uniref:reverse transcriptase/maturase family protein n=1 Tax=Bacillus cereus TaxID=1396 RepID=UPI000BBFD749|nr:reverse transcriptase/maturase family protein [Bacillus cereus]ASZ65918.1 group II intron reverse transcriptase/maturase [Bacillus cereus]MDA2515937.1 reverse transcriptase domain-containing protein [Bacillus cereus]